MAMTKAERKAFADMEQRLYLAMAWRRTGHVERDLRPPESGGLSKGWDFNSHNLHVYKSCSSSVSHGSGWEKTSTQNARSLYSTRERAIAALRYAVEQESVERLAKIDRLFNTEHNE